jgi:hypothetical protein
MRQAKMRACLIPKAKKRTRIFGSAPQLNLLQKFLHQIPFATMVSYMKLSAIAVRYSNHVGGNFGLSQTLSGVYHNPAAECPFPPEVLAPFFDQYIVSTSSLGIERTAVSLPEDARLWLGPRTPQD